jgi:NADH-quinone oxidoreductase subunit N
MRCIILVLAICQGVTVEMFSSYLGTLTSLKVISASDLLFLASSSILMILSGSLLTIRKSIHFALGKTYTVVIVYSFLLYILLTNNLALIGLTHLDNSVIFSNCYIDHITTKFTNLLYIFVFIFFIIVYAYISTRQLKTTFEYPIILFLAFTGMVLLLKFSDTFIWFLAIELQSFCMYALAAYRTNRSYLQTEAGLKYFLFGSVASSLYLFGISIFYLFFGTVDFDCIAALSYFPLENHYIYHIALILVFISLFLKLGIAPFHFWLPIVYTYSSSIITYMFILLPKIPLLYLLYKFSSLDYSYLMYLPLIISLFTGTIFAFKATNLKTFFAYSSIANLAFLLAPLLNQSIFSFYSFILYLFSYNILITIAFLPILFLTRSDKTNAFINLRDLIILKKSNPLLGAFYALVSVSLAGTPPLLGFFSKLFILISTLSFSAYFLTCILLGFSLLAAYYYLRLIKILYFPFSLKYASLSSIPLIPAIIISSFSLVNLFFTFCPTYFLILIS